MASGPSGGPSAEPTAVVRLQTFVRQQVAVPATTTQVEAIGFRDGIEVFRQTQARQETNDFVMPLSVTSVTFNFLNAEGQIVSSLGPIAMQLSSGEIEVVSSTEGTKFARFGVTSASSSIAKGVSTQLTATGLSFDGTSQDVTSSTTFVSSDTAVATVNGAGLVTALAPGTTTITATNLNGQTATTVITVTSAILTEVDLVLTPSTVAAGTSAGFTVTGSFSDKTTQDLTSVAQVSFSTPNIASVSGSGIISAGNTAGNTNVTASFGGKADTEAFTVSGAAILSMKLQSAETNGATSVALSQSINLQVIATLSDNSTQNVTGSVTFSQSTTDSGALTVGGVSDGKVPVTGVTAGTTTVTATLANVPSDSLLIRILPAPSSGPAARQPLTITGNSIFNTDTGALNGTVVPSYAGSLVVSDFAVASGARLTLEGQAPFIVDSDGNIDITGQIEGGINHVAVELQALSPESDNNVTLDGEIVGATICIASSGDTTINRTLAASGVIGGTVDSHITVSTLGNLVVGDGVNLLTFIFPGPDDVYDGGFISLSSDGNQTFGANFVAAAAGKGGGSGGEIFLETGGDQTFGVSSITVGGSNATASSPGGDGGELTIYAEGNQIFAGQLAIGANGGGNGGEVTVVAGGSQTFANLVIAVQSGTLDPFSAGGDGGEVTIGADGSQAFSDVSIVANGDKGVASPSSPGGDGGAVTIGTNDSQTFNGRVTIASLGGDGAPQAAGSNSDGTDGGDGGTIELSAGGAQAFNLVNGTILTVAGGAGGQGDLTPGSDSLGGNGGAGGAMAFAHASLTTSGTDNFLFAVGGAGGDGDSIGGDGGDGGDVGSPDPSALINAFVVFVDGGNGGTGSTSNGNLGADGNIIPI